MTKILQMTRSEGRTGSDLHPAADPLEPTQPLSSRGAHSAYSPPLPLVRPGYPAAQIVGLRPYDILRVA